MVYQFKKGSHLKGNAQAAGEMCAELESKGMLTASNLVDANRKKSAPLHGMFEWNDAVAGEEWRKHQARHIINSIVACDDRGENPRKEYYNVVVTSPVYESVQTIIQNEDKYQKLLEMARREMAQFEKKYHAIIELSNVFDAIHEFEATVA